MKPSSRRNLSRASLALALIAAASFTLPVLARGPRGGGPGGGEGPIDPELASARKQLMAATVVAKLDLSKEQKAALKKIVLQAREVREEGRNDADAKRHRAEARALLERATAEVRANGGEMSADTRAALEAHKAERAPQRQAQRATMKELMVSARNVLTPEQQAKLHELRGPGGPGAHGPRGPGFGPGGEQGFGGGPGPCAKNPEACQQMRQGRRGPGGPGFGPGAGGPQARHGQRQGKKMMKLLLSDEFLAELSR
ncbi:MAG: Spy/CpxP family protein refolding chaperone [Deltaproteobacteria bacterium]|nr:Spy/CpxP family protein refolding chaperone [Deltaproteobacteria bacterium]